MGDTFVLAREMFTSGFWPWLKKRHTLKLDSLSLLLQEHSGSLIKPFIN